MIMLMRNFDISEGMYKASKICSVPGRIQELGKQWHVANLGMYLDLEIRLDFNL